jgi:hypothetical protein
VGEVAVSEPAAISTILSLVIWKPVTDPRFKGDWDIGLDKAAAKAALDRQSLKSCISFLSHASDSWLTEAFEPRLSVEAHTAMGADGTVEGLRYLASRLAADVSRAAGMNP